MRRKEDHVQVFRILDEVSKNGDVTQRSLSLRLGVALGLTNLYVRRLGKKGYIKIVNLKANRLRYELTPSGLAQKTALAFQYVQDSYVFYREARKSLTKTFKALKVSGAQTVILFGTGELAEIALLSLQEANMEVAGIVSARHAGQSLCGRLVHEPASIASIAHDRVVVVERERKEALNVLAELGVNESTVVCVGV
jgi:DNA-binding MarR family transcriptional regulator